MSGHILNTCSVITITCEAQNIMVSVISEAEHNLHRDRTPALSDPVREIPEQ